MYVILCSCTVSANSQHLAVNIHSDLTFVLELCGKSSAKWATSLFLSVLLE